MALELAIAHPDVVDRLVLVDTDLPGVPLSPELRAAIGAAAALARAGDLDQARAAGLATPFFARCTRGVADALREIPGAQTAVLEGAGHVANMDAPAAFDAGLLEFLESVQRGAA